MLTLVAVLLLASPQGNCRTVTESRRAYMPQDPDAAYLGAVGESSPEAFRVGRFVVQLYACDGLQEKSLVDQLVARPDPRNGYEDYLRAADVVDEPAFFAIWQRDEGKTYLEVRKTSVERYGKALDFVRAGNKKQAWNPASSALTSAKRPQMQAFLALPKLCCAEAYVDFAEGHPSRGVQSLLDGITFCWQIRSGTTMDYLVGRIGADIVYTQCAESLNSVSEPDCRAIEAYVDARLAAPDPFQEILKNWLDAKLANLTAIFDLKPGEPVGDAKLAPAVEVIGRLTPGERRDAANQIRDRVRARFADYAQKLENSEGGLMSIRPVEEPGTVSTASDLVDFLSAWLSPNVPIETILVDRTQLRLLGLHARVIDYRWRNGKLPATLKDAAPGETARDPASGGTFVYEPHGDGTYRLYSKGFGVGGPVELGHQETRVRIGGTGVPPPARTSARSDPPRPPRETPAVPRGVRRTVWDPQTDCMADPVRSVRDLLRCCCL